MVTMFQLEKILVAAYLVVAAVIEVQAQTIMPNGAMTFSVGSGGTLLPVIYFNGYGLKLGIDEGHQAGPKECAQRCKNVGSCKAFAFKVDSGSASNCFISTSCAKTPANIILTTGYDYFIIVENCEFLDVGQLISVTGVALTDQGMSVTYANAALTGNAAPDMTSMACGLACEVTTTCVAAEFTATKTCKHFPLRTTDPPAPACPATSTDSTKYVWFMPCNYKEAANWDNIIKGTLSTPRSKPTFKNFMECVKACHQDNTCSGIRYRSDAEYSGLMLTDKCQFYAMTAQPMVCSATVMPASKVFTMRKLKCDEDYERMENKRLIGGVVQQGSTTLDDCKRSCKSDVNCVGIDWNRLAATSNTQRCWHLTEGRGGCDTPIPSGSSGVFCCDHYQRKPSLCSTVDGYYKFSGISVPSGVLFSNAATCRQTCIDDLNCEGYDITTGGSCFKHTRQTVCGMPQQCVGCTHFRKKTFECTWKFIDTKIIGGTMAPRDTIQTVGQCEKYCRLDALCKGFDFDPTMMPTPCFGHRIDSICTPRVLGNGINHYRIRNVVCTGEPVATNNADEQQNFHTIGNTLLDTGLTKSAIECIIKCSNKPHCEGIDYDKKTHMCYQATRTNACSTGIADTCCDRIPLKTACVAATVPNYGVQSLRHRLKGVFLRNGTTALECANLCTLKPDCSAIDHNHNGECWLHTSTQECTNTNLLLSNNCCDHYQKSTLRCVGNYAPPVFTDYTLTEKTFVSGGTEIKNKRTETACTAACTADPLCQAVDFNFKDNTCWAGRNSCANPNQNSFVYRYVKKTAPCGS